MICSFFTLGYPSDGIMQVEEEEEANNDSDDHDTYTVEDDEYPSHQGAGRSSNRKPMGAMSLRSAGKI